MLVKWTEARALTIHRPGKGRETSHSILVPGYNDVDDAEWGAVSKQPAVQRMVEKRKLVTKTPSKDNKKSGKGLLRFDLQEANEIISETYGKKILSEWRSHETRTPVINDIDFQIKRVDDSVAMRKEDEEFGPSYSERS